MCKCSNRWVATARCSAWRSCCTWTALTAVGLIVCFWAWRLDNALQGCLGDVGPQMLAYVVDWRGDPAELLDALITAGFVDVHDDDGSMWVHDWDEYIGVLIARREANAARMRASRAEDLEPRIASRMWDASLSQVIVLAGPDQRPTRKRRPKLTAVK